MATIEKASHQTVEFIADSNIAPAQTILDAGLTAVSSAVEIRVVDGNGNTLHLKKDGHVGQAGAEAGKYVVGLSKSYRDERGDLVADVEVSTSGEIDPTAQVSVEDMPEGFIPTLNNMPQVEFSIQEHDIVERLLEGQIFKIHPKTPALAALASFAHFVGERADVDIYDGSTHLYSHLSSS